MNEEAANDNGEERILDAIRDLASRERQEKLWWLRDDYNPNEFSSPVEMIVTLFDDFQFERFIASKVDLTLQRRNATDRLISAVDSIEDASLTGPPVALLDSEEWQAIRHAAAAFLDEWERR